MGYTALNVALLDGRLHNRLATAYTETKRENFDPDGFVFQTFDANGRNTRFEYQGILDITESLRATFGAETEHSRFITASFGGPPTRGEARHHQRVRGAAGAAASRSHHYHRPAPR